MRRRLATVSCLLGFVPGCMALTPQLPPTDFGALELLADREDRERAMEENAIYVHREPQGLRYTKGRSEGAVKRSWQSLDAVLRSDRLASEALPVRKLFLARFFLGLAVIGAAATAAATAATAREGLDLKNVSGPGAVLIASSVATVAFAVTSGIFYGQARKGYAHAVDVYNDSLGMRLGLLTADGRYIPPGDVLVDEEGNVVLDAPAPPAARPQGPAERAPGGATEAGSGTRGGSMQSPGMSGVGPSGGEQAAGSPGKDRASPEAEAGPAAGDLWGWRCRGAGVAAAFALRRTHCTRVWRLGGRGAPHGPGVSPGPSLTRLTSAEGVPRAVRLR